MTPEQHHAVAIYPQLLEALKAARAEIAVEHDGLRAACVDTDGDFFDPGDAEAVGKLDALLARLDALLLVCRLAPKQASLGHLAPVVHLFPPDSGPGTPAA